MGSPWTASPGVALIGHEVPGQVTRWARLAESAGLASVWVIEDYFHPGAYALAGAAGAATERITIGLGVVNPYTRHPALIAMETGALAGIAPGRIVLGLGSSNRNWIEEQLRIPFKTPLRALREAVEIVRRLLAGERLTLHGECFDVEGVRLEFIPAARVPILLGVKGPKALALAGEIADGVHGAVLTSPAHIRRIRATTAAARGARDGDFEVIAYVPTAIGRDGARARALVRPLLARYLGVLHGQSILADAGLAPARTQPFRDALGAGRVATDLVTDDLISALAVAGTPEQGRAALRRLAAAGLDAPIAVVPPGADLDEQLALIGRELVPYWKDLAAGLPSGPGRG
jgi:alkanesulfonate monooxygenase SsuD/methylene tetrahydromethanopterin reductase-like flavin-dependent oxidoreductase (luciferase family)